MEAETITFAITYGKQNFTITMGKEKTLGDLKQEIYRVTGVEPAQQKLTGLVPAGHNLRKISDATPLGDGLVKGQKWRRPKQRMVMFGMPERVLSKQISEEQEALRKTQEIRESLEAADAHDKALEEESARIAAATKKAEDEAYRKIVEQHVKRVKTLEESLTSGFLGAPLPVHSGGSMPTQATRRINRGGEIETTQRESSQLTESGSGSDLGAKVETTLIAYSSVMAEDQNGLLDISAKVILPRSIFDEVIQKRVALPLAFKVEGISSVGETTSTVLGVMDFGAPEGVAFFPHWVIKKLNIEDGTQVRLETIRPPKGHSATFRPLCTESAVKKYGDIQALLEHHLQRYQFLTVGDFVQIPLDKENGIQFEVTDVRIDDETRVESISTVDVDLLTTIESYKNESGGESAGNEANNMEMKSDETSEITLGEESMQNVPCGEYKHLRVSVKDKEDAVVIAVRPITGDPDVYVSLTDKNEQPDWTNYDVCDQTEGTRVLRVDALQSNNIYIGLHDYNNRVNSKCVVVVFYESDNGLKEKYCGRKLIDAASSGSSDANNTIDHGTCMFCGQKIPKAGMRLHELRCKRMNFKCEKCGTVAPARRKEKHMKLAHTKIQCQCGVELEQEALQAHRQRECPYQIGVCRYCGLSLRQGDLGEHQEVCGSKSYTCAHCGKNILRRNFLEHLHIQHKINSINLKNDTK